MQHAYRTLRPNAEVELYSGPLRVFAKGLESSGTGRVWLAWIPRPAIRFQIPGVTTSRLGLDAATIELSDNGGSRGCHVLSVGDGGLQGIVDREGIVWSKLTSQPVTRLVGSIPNFHPTYGAFVHLENGGGRRAHRRFEADPWRVSLDDHGTSVHKALRALGGFAFTHTIKIERIDGAAFDPTSADDFIRLLDRALSFALGRWTGVVLPVGLDASGSKGAESWRLPMIDPAHYEHSWFPLTPHPVLESLIPRFAAANESGTDVADALRNCVHWYIEANAGNGGLEGAIVMTMIALELLAWLELVNRRECIAAENFERMKAFDKIRTYFSIRGISYAVPTSSLPAFAAHLTSEKDCPDGIVALTRLRNRSVHPPRSTGRPGHPDGLLEEAWRFGLLLLERAILSEVGYRGWITERVGWTQERVGGGPEPTDDDSDD